MRPDRHIARDISYCYSAQTRGGRAMIRTMENLTGRMGLIRRAAGYEREISEGRCFWEVIVERYGLSLDVAGGSLESIPRDGPLILIANHPYGILDGLMMGHILSRTRGDFRILANSVFTKAAELQKVVFPISFEETNEARRQNQKGLRKALQYVKNGGALGVFPGGTVATAKTMFGQPAEPMWPETVASILLASKATCLPIFFFGSNSRIFQISSHLHNSLRLGLFVGEFGKRVGKPLPVVLGRPISAEQIARSRNDRIGLTRSLRSKTLELGGVSPHVVGRQYLRGS